MKARRFEVLRIYHHFRRLDRPLAVAAMVPAVLSGTGLVTASTTAETAFSAIAVASAAYLLWRATSPLMSRASRPAVLVALTLATVLPEYVVDIRFAWSGAGSIGSEGTPMPSPPFTLKEVKAIFTRVDSVRAAADEELETQRIFSNIANLKANSTTLLAGQTVNDLPVGVSTGPVAEAIPETPALATAEVSDQPADDTQPKAAKGHKAAGKRNKKAAK